MNRIHAVRLLNPALALLLVAASAHAALQGGADDWSHWRGPEGNGVARGSAPLRWSDSENVLWKAEVPGRGFSTPVLWGDRLFVTTAVPIGEAPEAAPEEGSGRRRRGGAPLVEHEFLVLCLDRADGKELWRRSACKATPHEGFHSQYGSFASPSPVTDGERLYVSFGSWGLYCYDLDGELVWQREAGVKLRMRNSFGEGTAPAIHGESLVQVYDHEGDSFVVCLDKATGEERWRAARDEPSTWATPLILEYEGVVQVITPGTTAVRAYDLATGEVLWSCSGLGTNPIPVPVRNGDDVLVMTGHRNPRLMAIRLGGAGDLTDGDHVLWSTTKGTSYTPSPVLHEGRLYCLMDRGFMSCYDAATGEGLYVEGRLPRGSQFKASPVGADGHLYLASESGDVYVVRMGPTLEVVATNTLADQFFVSSPVIADGRLYLRSETHLFCIGASDEEG
jgi:outer membrane protein assembly factor BamB